MRSCPRRPTTFKIPTKGVKMVAGNKEVSTATLTSKEQAVGLCKEGDHKLATEEPSHATAFYMAAFSCSGPVAIQKVASLEEDQAKVMKTLESWCQGESPIPQLQGSNLKIPWLDVGIAAIFLSTLSPNNMAASLYKMGALLKVGRYEEVVRRCNSLLEAQNHTELVLTRALALLLSKSDVQTGVEDYLHAFVKHRDKTVEFIHRSQKEYLHQIIQAFFDVFSLQENGDSCEGPESWPSGCYDFLGAIGPEDLHVCQAQGAHLLGKRRYKESVSVYSKALEALSENGACQDDRTLGILLDRAAAYFCLGGKVMELIQDLVAAFEINPKLAKERFEEVFSTGDADRIRKDTRAALDEKFAAYREAVCARPEFRSDGGKELLSPVISTLHVLIQISPGAREELKIRLADCFLLQGNIQRALDICHHLLASNQGTYCNTLLALRGFCRLHAKSYKQALDDFQEVIEHSSPHPSSCVKALCGRGMIRAWGGSPYLTALDYITACSLRCEETHFVIKSYIPWNQRGFLLVVLQEEARKILENKKTPRGSSGSQQNKSRKLNELQVEEGDVSGVLQLAFLLLDLDTSNETSRLLCADALYQMGRGDEAHKMLLVALSKSSQRSAILARLALLQLKKGFLYDCNQLLKKITQSGETSCFLSLVKVLKDGDRALMQRHCQSRAMTILKNKQGEGYLKEAILYLSLSITAAGGYAVDSLLIRARCYGQLGQKKTAIFDFNTILKDDPTNVQALCGKGFVHLSLNQEKETVHNLTSALRADTVWTVTEILSLKKEAQTLIHQWLLSHCKDALLEFDAQKKLLGGEIFKELSVVGEALMKINSTDINSHIIYVDLLAADGRHKEALTYLQESFGQKTSHDSIKSRLGMLQAKKRNLTVSAHILASLAAKDYQELGYLLNFLDNMQRKNLAQVAAKEGNALVKEQCHAKAMGYYSLAVLASNGNPRCLCQRAACLSHLKEYRKALKDMDSVIQNHGTNGLRTQVEDYCFQGHVFLSLSEEESAVKQYSKAFQLDESLALGNIPTGPERDKLSKAFLQTAQSYWAGSHYKEAWKVTEYGLKVDPNNHDLKKLKARMKREASGCKVQ
ncbi:tetratricopeptide repeat protein 34 [Pogona vitticeps]